jgi:hypothetical protein
MILQIIEVLMDTVAIITGQHHRRSCPPHESI